MKNLVEIFCDVDDFMVNLIAGLIAYTYQEKKPSLKINRDDLQINEALQDVEQINYVNSWKEST